MCFGVYSLGHALKENNQYEFDKTLLMLDSYAHVSIHLTQKEFDVIKNWKGFSAKYASYYDYKGHAIVLKPDLI